MGVGAWCLPAVEGEALIAAQRCRSKHALGDPIRIQLMLNTARLKAMNHDNEIWVREARILRRSWPWSVGGLCTAIIRVLVER